MKAAFVDTMGWYSLLDSRDAFHPKAARALQLLQNRRARLLTTDYIVDETATLLKVRGATRTIHAFFRLLEASKALTVTSIDSGRFSKTVAYFLQHIDHRYSFTDVSSFIVMKELGISDAFTHDKHFSEAGFNRLLT